jgi:TonB family protein
MNASRSRSTLISGVLHAAAIVAILLFTGVKTRPVPVPDHVQLYLPKDLPDFRTHIPRTDNAGGGGGGREKTPASAGVLPAQRRRPLLPPMVSKENTNPILTVEPALLSYADVPKLDIGRIGSPTGVDGPPSNGPGKCCGIGNGDGDGVGDNKGFGVGKGDQPGVAATTGFQGLTTLPVALYHPDPEYSEEARKAKVQGMVQLMIMVDAKGLPTNIKVQRSLGLGLDEKAVETVGKWKFKPATKNGKPVPAPALIEVSFRLL